MLIEGIVAGWTIFAGVTYWEYKQGPSEKKVIKETFANTKYGFGDKLPKLKKMNKTETHNEYLFSVPSGLIDHPRMELFLESALNRPVRIELESLLSVKVYNHKLQTRYDYEYEKGEAYSFPIGVGLEGPVWHDFKKIPHMSVGGTTRYGKTVLLKLLMYQMIRQHPDDVEFYILDLKGGLEFHRYRNLRQVVTVASDVQEAKRALMEVIEKIEDQEERFKRNGYQNINDTPIKKRTFIIVDEGAQLCPPTHATTAQKRPYQYCQAALAEIARIGGGLGFYEIFCTQYPVKSTLPSEIKQNTDAKVAFRLPTETGSRVVLDEDGAQFLKNPGRCIYRTAERQEVQVPYITDEDIWKELKWYETDDDETAEEGKGGAYLDFLVESEICDSGAVESDSQPEEL